MELICKILGIATAAAEAAAPVATEVPQMSTGETIIGLLFGTVLPMALVFGAMYFIMIRPERKRRKKEQAMLAALKPGDRICTIGGIYGTITSQKDDTFTLSVGRDNLSMVVARWAIRSVEDVTIENESEALN